MIQTETREIDGVNFEVRGLDLRTERAVFIRLSKVLGPAIAELVRAGGTDGTADAIRQFVGALEDSEIEFLCQTFGKVTKYQIDNGAWVPYMEAAFKSGFSSQMKWLWFCLEHQYKAFLSGKLSTVLQQFQVKAASG